MNTLEFAAEVIFLSASAVLYPGPLFLGNLILGSKQGFWAGIKIANGHSIVEFSLIMILGLALFRILPLNLTNGNLRIVGIVGGLAMIFFSIVQLIDIINRKGLRDINHYHSRGLFFTLRNKTRRLDEALILGILFSVLNPFFLIWWFTVGLKLISDSISIFGIILGLVFLFSFHIWMDYAWLGASSFFISKGRSILKVKFYYIFIIAISIMLASYGLNLIIMNSLFVSNEY
jgi:threonine/homoserine/homoserine lactone efflux protein